MDFRSTEDVVSRDTTLAGKLPVGPSRHVPFGNPPHNDYYEGRSYGPLRQDTMKKAGHLDSRNKRLTVPNREAHTLRHANRNNRNPGDRVRHLGMRAYEDRRTPRGSTGIYLGGAVMGDEMKNVVTVLDAKSSVNAVEVEDFQHGGTEVGAARGPMIGAGVSVPTGNMDTSDLNNAFGLHYAVNMKPGDAIGTMQRGDFAQDIARQQETPNVPRAKPYAS
jgi:hypothetical protein